MAAKHGKLFLLKLGTDAISTARATSMSINNNPIDVSNKASNNWGSTIAGLANMTITLDGTYEDTTVEKTINGYAMDGSSNAYTLINEGGDTWEGDFVITAYSRTGDYNGAETFSMTLQNNGEITYTPHV